jgi:hypothetical protein
LNTKVKGKTLADFRAKHDKSVIVPAKLNAALAAMVKEGGGDNWDYEGDFLKRAGVANQDASPFRDQFKAHIVETGGRNAKRVWVATAKGADKFRSAL